MALLRPSGAGGGIFHRRPAARDAATPGEDVDDPGAANDVVAAVQSRSATVDVVAPEGAEEERPLAYLSAGVIQEKARHIARESISMVAGWRSSERARQVGWDVADACASHFLGDLPRNSIIPRVFYSTLKREAKNWWQQKQQQQQQPLPSAQTGKVDGSTPNPPGGGDMAEEVKALLLEMDQLRAEVRELRREVGLVRAQMGETKVQEELPGSASGAGPGGSSQPAPAEWENLLSRAAGEVSGKVMRASVPEVADAIEKLRFWEGKREVEQVGSSATGKT